MNAKISRRDLLKSGAGAMGLAALAGPGAARTRAADSDRPAAGSDADERPNILIIHTDQQNCWTLGAYGGDLIETPHIDSLAREGVIFSNFFTNSAVCTPSRGCFLTGRYPHIHGAYKNAIPLNRDEVTLAAHLRARGYETGYAGKWHLDGAAYPGWLTPGRSMGFSDCRYMFNRGHWKTISDSGGPRPKLSKTIGDEKTYSTDWLCDKTIEFINRRREGPFCFMVGILDPHPPYSVRAPYNTIFKSKQMPLPATFAQKDVPSWARASNFQAPDAAALRAIKAKYCGQVKCIDDNVGRVIGALRAANILDRTIVVYTSDHGDYMGEHGLMGKSTLYETAYRIPLLIRWPKGIAGGSRIEHVTSTVDFVQTICGLIGISPTGREQGRDASPLLRGERRQWVDEAFLHHTSHKRAGIFTSEFELALAKEGEHVLFDRKRDPDQIDNLFQKEQFQGARDELIKRVIQHHAALKSPAAQWLKSMI